MADLTTDQNNVLDQLAQFLSDNGLPASLLNFIRTAVVNSEGPSQILMELRQTPEYKAAFPENALREANGFSFMPESQILSYRDEAKRLSMHYLGTQPSDADIANAIGQIRQVVAASANERRRYLVIASGTPKEIGPPVQRQVLP